MTFLFLYATNVSTFWKAKNCRSGWCSESQSQFVLGFFFIPHSESSLYFYIFYTKYKSKTESSFTTKYPVLYLADKEKQTLKAAKIQIVNEWWLKNENGILKFCLFLKPGNLIIGPHWQLESTLALPSGQGHKILPQTICTRNFSSQDSENVDSWYQTCLAEECHAHHKIWAITLYSYVVLKRNTGPSFPTLFLVDPYLPVTTTSTRSHVFPCSHGDPKHSELLFKTSVIQLDLGVMSLGSWTKRGGKKFPLHRQTVCPSPRSSEVCIQISAARWAARKPAIKQSRIASVILGHIPLYWIACS